jgi:predicted secreted protein
MATYTGENGQVRVDDSSGSPVAVAEVRSWTLDHTKDVIEDTVMGDAARTYKSGLHQFSGSMEVVYDDSKIDAQIFNPDSDTELTAEFYPNSSTGYKFSGEIIVTSVSRSASFDDLITASISFQGTGALSTETV